MGFSIGLYGAQSILIAGAFSLFGTSVDTYHLLMGCYGIIFSISVYFAAISVGASRILAMTATLFALLGYSEWWYLNPGLSVEILMVWVLVCLLKWQQNDKRGFLALAGLICGFALSFKQTGVLVGVGSVAVVSLVRLSRNSENLLRRLVIAMPPVLCFMGFVILRVF